jgi:hypothetical protein
MRCLFSLSHGGTLSLLIASQHPQRTKPKTNSANFESLGGLNRRRLRKKTGQQFDEILCTFGSISNGTEWHNEIEGLKYEA